MDDCISCDCAAAQSQERRENSGTQEFPREEEVANEEDAIPETGDFEYRTGSARSTRSGVGAGLQYSSRDTHENGKIIGRVVGRRIRQFDELSARHVTDRREKKSGRTTVQRLEAARCSQSLSEEDSRARDSHYHRSCAHKRAEEESVEEEEEEKRNEPEFVTLGDSDNEVTEKKEEQRPRQRPSRIIKNINSTG